MAITPSDFSKIWASNADTPEYTFSEANYLKGWDFVGNLPPTRAQWNAIQKRTDEKMKYVFDNFGAPLTASTVAEMTLQNRVYVYIGSEVGYTAGHWYYYAGNAWTDGGVYNAVAFNTDPTLTISGAAADAKVTGNRFAEVTKKMTLVTSQNLYNDNAATVGTIYADGSISTNASYVWVKIDVEPGDVINSYNSNTGGNKGDMRQICAYDSDGNVVSASGVSSYVNTYTVPNGIYKIAVTLMSAYSSTFMILKNNVSAPTEYIPYVNPYYIGDVDFVPKLAKLDALDKSVKTGYLFSGEPVEHNGFIGSNGVIYAQTGVVAEVYTDKYDAYPGIEINGKITLNDGADSFWFAYAIYDTNGAFIRRTVLVNSVTMSQWEGTVVVTDSNVGYIAFTYRTYGNATASFEAKLKPFADIDTDILSVGVGTVNTIGHRGDQVYAPMNTAPAYILAKKNGVSTMENDLALSEDGYFVMWHDTDLKRLGDMVDINGYLMYTDGTDYYWVDPDDSSVYTWDGTDYVASAVDLATLTRCKGINYGVNSEYGVIGLNLDVLKRIDFGVYKGSQYAGTQILTLEEFVILCKKLNSAFYLDKKLTYTDALITQAATVVKKHGMGDFASWLGLNLAQINVLRTVIPKARCGVLVHPTAEYIIAYADANIGNGFFFNGDATTITESAVQLGLNAGFQVECWYVGDYSYPTQSQAFEKIREAVSYGVTGMTLDHYKVTDAFQYLLDEF